MADEREKLRELALEIRRIVEDERGLIAPSILPSLGVWFTAAVGKYLRGKEPSLEKALGLRSGKRGPKPLKTASAGAKRLAQVRKNKSLGEAADELNLNERGLQRKQKRFASRLEADRIAAVSAKLQARLASKPKPRPRRPFEGG